LKVGGVGDDYPLLYLKKTRRLPVFAESQLFLSKFLQKTAKRSAFSGGAKNRTILGVGVVFCFGFDKNLIAKSNV